VAIDAYRLEKPIVKKDVEHITAEYLISNIELAFKVWREQRWGKDIPFDVFCEEILPYRLSTEPLENWREKALAIFFDIYTTFATDTTISLVDACTKLNAALPRFKLDNDFPPMSFSQLMASARGPCDAMVASAVFSMRAFGIPVTNDYTPKWPDRRPGHTWNSINAGKSGYISFMGAESDPGKPHQGNTLPKYKAYRRTFARQVNIAADVNDIPPTLRNPYMKDVSSEYEGCVDVTVPTQFKPDKPTGYAYLAVRIGDEWSPIAWGITKQSEIEFAAVGKQLLYLPVYYADNQQKAAGYPFWVKDDGTCRLIQADTQRSELVLLSIAPDSETYFEYMQRGRFEGANYSDFSDAKVLYSINKVRGGFYHTANLSSAPAYRYLRYIPAQGQRCDLAELAFYEKNGNKLTGNAIGAPGTSPSMTRENAFDGDVATIASPSNAWVGLDLGKPTVVGRIRFLPRSQSRGIYEGHSYELSYWGGQQWIGLRQQVASSHQLRILAPHNALFRLRNTTLNLTGQYFTMENGKQMWLQ
jgi:hypothetical protein